jgi:hypothetical protein
MIVHSASPLALVVRSPLAQDRRLAVDVRDRTRAHRSSLERVEGALGKLEHSTDGSDREAIPMGIDERDVHRDRGSAS